MTGSVNRDSHTRLESTTIWCLSLGVSKYRACVINAPFQQLRKYSRAAAKDFCLFSMKSACYFHDSLINHSSANVQKCEKCSANIPRAQSDAFKLLLRINSQKPKYFSFTKIIDKENKQILTYNKQEPAGA